VRRLIDAIMDKRMTQHLLLLLLAMLNVQQAQSQLAEEFSEWTSIKETSTFLQAPQTGGDLVSLLKAECDKRCSDCAGFRTVDMDKAEKKHPRFEIIDNGDFFVRPCKEGRSENGWIAVESLVGQGAQSDLVYDLEDCLRTCSSTPECSVVKKWEPNVPNGYAGRCYFYNTDSPSTQPLRLTYLKCKGGSKADNCKQGDKGACEAVVVFDLNQHDATDANLGTMKTFTKELVDGLDDEVAVKGLVSFKAGEVTVHDGTDKTGVKDDIDDLTY